MNAPLPGASDGSQPTPNFSPTPRQPLRDDSFETHPKHDNWRARCELIFIALLAVAGYVLAARTDAFEVCVAWLHSLGDDRQIDEMVISFLIAGLGFGVFSWRRWRELLEESRRCDSVERKLSKREEQFRQAQCLARMGAWEWDIGRNTLFWSDELCHVYGLRPGEFAGTYDAFLEFVPPEEREDTRARIEQALRDHAPFVYQHRILRRDGQVRVLHSQGMVEIGDNGEPARLYGACQDVTEMRQAQSALEQSVSLLQATLESTADGILVVDREGKIASHNCKFLEMWHLPESLATSDDAELMAACLEQLRDPDAFVAKVGELYSRPEAESHDVIEFLDGRVFERYSQPQRLRGEVVGRVWSFQDVTARMQAEQELRTQAAAMDALMDGVGITDREGKFLYANDAHARVYGYRKTEELLGRSWQELYDPAELDRLMHEAMSTLQAEGHWRGECRGIRRDGSTFPQEISLTNVHDGKVVCVVRDITWRKQAEDDLQAAHDELERRVEERTLELTAVNATLHQSESKYRSVVEHATEVIYQTDAEGRWTFLNPAWTRILGYSIEESLGRNFLDYVHPDDREECKQTFPRLVNGDSNHECRHVVRHVARDGDVRWLEVFARLTRNEQGHVIGTTGTLNDVTEQTQAREEADRANRAKSEFLSRMSHELRTPLNAILGFGQLLELEELSDEQSESVEQIMHGGHHLLELINEVLDIARIEAGRMQLTVEPVEVAEVIEDVLSLARPLAQEREIDLRSDQAEYSGLFVMADVQRLRQVVLNLVANAVKYNAYGGQVTVSAQLETTQENAEGGGAVRIAVRDTGPGIAPENMERLFQPFERLGAEATGAEGTGLGLALSQHLCEAMNGCIGATSTPGHGSTFWVILPAAAPVESASKSETRVRAAPELPEQDALCTVLQIEDNATNMRLIEQLFARWPEVRLISASQGSLGVELACRHLPDLILLDVHLPDIKGDEVLRRLRAAPETRDIPVVVLSADATAGQKKNLLEAGAWAYLTKPLDIGEFYYVTGEVLGRSAQPVQEE